MLFGFIVVGLILLNLLLDMVSFGFTLAFDGVMLGKLFVDAQLGRRLIAVSITFVQREHVLFELIA